MGKKKRITNLKKLYKIMSGTCIYCGQDTIEKQTKHTYTIYCKQCKKLWSISPDDHRIGYEVNYENAFRGGG